MAAAVPFAAYSPMTARSLAVILMYSPLVFAMHNDIHTYVVTVRISLLLKTFITKVSEYKAEKLCVP